MSVSVQSPGPTGPPEPVVTTTNPPDPEQANNNNNNVNNNNNNNNNNNSGSGGAGGGKPGGKEGKLPPCSSISNIFWDPNVDGELVNMPLAPQLLTPVQPGEELDDLTALVGPELATLVPASPDQHKQFPVDNININPCDFNSFPQNIDFDKFLGDYAASGEGREGGPPSQTIRKVIIARKLGGAGAGGGPQAQEDNNNNNNSGGGARESRPALPAPVQ